MKYELSKHAAEMLARRGISREWLEATLDLPQRFERDPSDSQILHHLRTIEAYDNRVLRVLINDGSSPVRIVSVFFDRRMKGKI